MQEAERQLQSEGGLCGFPIRPDDRRFGVVTWKPVAPEDSLVPIKSFFAWFISGSNYLSPQSYAKRQRSGPDLLNADSVEDLWRRYSQNIPALIGSGAFQLETASLQLDGTPIQIYRTTVVDPDTYPEIGAWKVRACTTPSGHSRPQTELYFPLRTDRWEEFKVMNAVPPSGEVVLWNSRAYAGWAGNASISLRGLTVAGGKLFYTGSVCEIRIEWE